jgi:uncharacterized protein YcaQ
MTATLARIRHDAATRSLCPPASLASAIASLGFVQADPIRAPARAQDLILRHRVGGYRAGDLERQYPQLAVEEDFFVNYGFVARPLDALMQPRLAALRWPAARRKKAAALLDFVRSRGEAHPREVDAHFAHGRVTNYWGGSSNATTHLLDQMHYWGFLHVARRVQGIRLYAVRETAAPAASVDDPAAVVDTLIDVLARKYAPLPARTLAFLAGRLRYAVPQWERHLKSALKRSRDRLASARAGGVDWYWPADDSAAREPDEDRVRLLAPFDPIVWDRRRFELLWGWPYRFAAYTPAAKRKFGYYAMPVLWHDRIVGWANATAAAGSVDVAFGYASGRPPRERAFARALDEEVERLRAFLSA